MIDFNGTTIPDSLTQSSGVPATFDGNAAVFVGTTNLERSYLRTARTNFNTTDFVAQITTTIPTGAGDQGLVFYGMGPGIPNPANFGQPTIPPTLVMRAAPDDFGNGQISVNDLNISGGFTPLQSPFGAAGDGTHRLQMSWDANLQQMVFSIDQNYTGGPFDADFTFAPVDGSDNGFTDALSSIFFGGSGGSSFDDLAIILPDLWASQVFSSGIPMNQAIGQVASSIHNTGVRDFNGRLFRNRSRWVPLDGDTLASQSSGGTLRGREVSASRLFRLGNETRELAGTHHINLDGATNLGIGTTGDLGPLTIDDDTPVLSVTRPAECDVAPGCLAHGSNWQVFGSANFGQVDLDPIGGNPALDSTTQASTLGVEFYLNDCLVVGAGWTHVWNDTDFASNLGAADIEGDAGVVYASYFRKNLWADLMYSFGSYQTDLTRNTGFGTTVRADPDIETHQVALNLGYNIGHCGGRIVHGPVFSATWTDGTLDGYTETGDTANNITFAEQEFDSLVTVVGWQANQCIETICGIIRPQFRIGYGREHFDPDQTIQATSPLFNLPTLTRSQLDPGEGWLDLGGGFSWQLRKNLSLLLDYNGQFFREDVDAVHYGSVRAQVGF